MTPLEITKENQNTLVATTIAFFLFPAAFLFYKEHYFHCACNTLSGIASVLYWTHPTNPQFHTADVYISRISTTLYVLTTLSIAYQLSIEHVISTCLLTTKTVYFYLKSRNAYDFRDPNWVIYHSIFHGMCCLSVIFCYVSKETLETTKLPLSPGQLTSQFFPFCLATMSLAFTTTRFLPPRTAFFLSESQPSKGT